MNAHEIIGKGGLVLIFVVCTVYLVGSLLRDWWKGDGFAGWFLLSGAVLVGLVLAGSYGESQRKATETPPCVCCEAVLP